MGKIAPHSEFTRMKVCAYHEMGLADKEISKKVGVKVSSIAGITKQAKAQKDLKYRPSENDHPALSDRDKRLIIRTVQRDPSVTAEELLEQTSAKVPQLTIKKFLKSAGYVERVLPTLEEFQLTQARALKRLTFAKQYELKTSTFWKNCIFSDENSVVLGIPGLWVYTREGESPPYVLPRTSEPCAQMFWSAFTKGQKSPLVALEGDSHSKRRGVTSQVVQQVFEEQLPNIVSDRHCYLVMNNAPIHKASSLTTWLEEFSAPKKLYVIRLPPGSPDLNPMTEVWKIVKEKIHKNNPEIGSLTDSEKTRKLLIKAAEEAWDEIELSVLENLVSSIPDKLKAIVAANDMS